MIDAAGNVEAQLARHRETRTAMKAQASVSGNRGQAALLKSRDLVGINSESERTEHRHRIQWRRQCARLCHIKNGWHRPARIPQRIPLMHHPRATLEAPRQTMLHCVGNFMTARIAASAAFRTAVAIGLDRPRPRCAGGSRFLPVRRSARHGGRRHGAGGARSSCPWWSSPSSGWCTSCRRRSPSSASTRRRTPSRSFACCRWCSAACSGRSPGSWPTASRCSTSWPTARTSTTTTTSTSRKQTRRTPRSSATDVSRLRAELDVARSARQTAR